MEKFMAEDKNQPIDIQDISPSFSTGGFALIVFAGFAGAVAAILVLPNWLPGMTQSLDPTGPKVFWYLSRGSAFTAYVLLWLSMILGAGITNKLAALWPGLPPTIDLHQYTSILGLAFGIFHGLILLGDHYINFKVFQVLLPFSTTQFKPVAVGVGQLGFYLWAIIIISFYVRKKIGSKTWRKIHFLSFVSFVFALLHGISSGTDSTTLWAQAIYWITGISLLYMIIYRILYTRRQAAEKRAELQKMSPPPIQMNH
jgi:predicted ferric reductase